MIDFKNKENRLRIITGIIFALYFIYILVLCCSPGIFIYQGIIPEILYNIIQLGIPLLVSLSMVLKKNKIPLAAAVILSICMSSFPLLIYGNILEHIFYSPKEYLRGMIEISEVLLPVLFLTVVLFNDRLKKSTTKFLLLFSNAPHIIIVLLGIIIDIFHGGIIYYFKLIFYDLSSIVLRIFLSMVLIKENKNNDNELSFEEGYYDLSLNIIFTILFGIVYKWGWIHRTTKYLNNASGYEKRSPIKKTLLCIFVPFYTIYWTHQSAKRIEKLAKDKKLEYTGNFTSIAIIFEIVLGLISPIYMQSRINSICVNVNQNNKNKQDNNSKLNNFNDIRKYKKLLDDEIITQEEFNIKKKELLNI